MVGQQGSDSIVNLPWINTYIESKKIHIDVDRPVVVGVYNTNMGGIDLFDMMSTLYKRLIKSRRWYFYIFYLTLTMSLIKAEPLPMKEFQIQAATSLMSTGKMPRRRPSLQSPPPAKKHKVQPSPQLDCRYDNFGHFPTSQEKKGRCRYCPTGFSFWTCTKCKEFMCLVCGKNPQNCFLAFHQK